MKRERGREGERKKYRQREGVRERKKERSRGEEGGKKAKCVIEIESPQWARRQELRCCLRVLPAIIWALKKSN